MNIINERITDSKVNETKDGIIMAKKREHLLELVIVT